MTQTTAPSPTEPLATQVIPTNTIGPIVFDSWCIPWQTERSQGTVTRVIDGVTIEVETDTGIVQVRYIGLSLASETLYPHSSLSAKEANHDLVDGQKVLMVKDRSETDEEGYLLRYVIANGIFVNQNLVYYGYAQANIIPPDTSCSNTLLEAESSAMLNHRGIYAPLATATRSIVLNPTATVHTLGEVLITTIQPLGDGWQDPNEYIELKNNSSHPIQMDGWTLRDLKGHSFIFPDFIIYSGNYCRIYTNVYRPAQCGLSFYSLSPIWDDTEDCAYLYNPLGQLVDEFCYGW
jgi:endonuclease YncB( thermonuclease family)